MGMQSGKEGIQEGEAMGAKARDKGHIQSEFAKECAASFPGDRNMLGEPVLKGSEQGQGPLGRRLCGQKVSG